MKRIVIWRHGRTSWNAEQRFQGQTDIDLDDVGISQARRAAAMLAGLGPAVVISSDLRRTRQTAVPLTELTGIEPTYDSELRETYAGEWEGLTRTEIIQRYGDQLSLWSAGADVRPGGGETRREVADRMVRAIGRGLASTPDDGILIVVTHGGGARAAIGQLLGLPPEHWAALGVLTNCAWSVLLQNDQSHGPRWRLQEYNAGSLPEAVPVDGVWPADDR